MKDILIFRNNSDDGEFFYFFKLPFPEDKIIYIKYKILIKDINLDKDINIYVLIADYYNNKEENHSKNVFGFEFHFENGKEISINIDIISSISAPIINFELVKYNYSIHFEEKEYDIYEKIAHLIVFVIKDILRIMI